MDAQTYAILMAMINQGPQGNPYYMPGGPPTLPGSTPNPVPNPYERISDIISGDVGLWETLGAMSAEHPNLFGKGGHSTFGQKFAQTTPQNNQISMGQLPWQSLFQRESKWTPPHMINLGMGMRR